MHDIDLRTALHEWADDTPAGQPPTADIIRSGGRRKRRRAAGIATSIAVAAAAVAAAGALVASPTNSTPVAIATKPAEAAPSVELAAAVTATTGQSFRFVVDSTLTLPAHGIKDAKGTCTGVLDPATQTGYVKSGSLDEHWAVGGKRYWRVGNHHYTLGPGDVSTFISCPIGRSGDPGFVNGDPDGLLRTLSTMSTVRKEDPRTYAFTGSGIRGTVTVIDGKVRAMTSTVDSPASGDAPAYHREITMALSAFGQPVNVRAPW